MREKVTSMKEMEEMRNLKCSKLKNLFKPKNVEFKTM